MDLVDKEILWTWYVSDGRPDEGAPVRAADPLAAMQVYLDAHGDDLAGEHAFTVRPINLPCPFPEVTVEVRRQAGGALTWAAAADPVAWAEAAAHIAGKKLRAEQRRYLRGPIVVGSSSWTDTPEWLRRAIPQARLRQVLREVYGQEPAGRATLEEVTAYLMAASLEAPLNRDAGEVYFWAAGQVLVQHGMVAADAFSFFWDHMGKRDGSPRLTDYQISEFLQPLQRHIRQSAARNAKETNRG